MDGILARLVRPVQWPASGCARSERRRKEKRRRGDEPRKSHPLPLAALRPPDPLRFGLRPKREEEKGEEEKR
ncbi:MAG: hypothetical protein ACO3SJ_08895, partial [Phycisphaerales bacterium]